MKTIKTGNTWLTGYAPWWFWGLFIVACIAGGILVDEFASSEEGLRLNIAVMFLFLTLIFHDVVITVAGFTLLLVFWLVIFSSYSSVQSTDATFYYAIMVYCGLNFLANGLSLYLYKDQLVLLLNAFLLGGGAIGGFFNKKRAHRVTVLGVIHTILSVVVIFWVISLL